MILLHKPAIALNPCCATCGLYISHFKAEQYLWNIAQRISNLKLSLESLIHTIFLRFSLEKNRREASWKSLEPFQIHLISWQKIWRKIVKKQSPKASRKITWTITHKHLITSLIFFHKVLWQSISPQRNLRSIFHAQVMAHVPGFVKLGISPPKV